MIDSGKRARRRAVIAGLISRMRRGALMRALPRGEALRTSMNRRRAR